MRTHSITSKSKLNLLLIALAFLINVQLTFAQGVMCTVSGKITNVKDNSPITGTIKFMSGNEQKAKSKINTNGEYSAVVPINANLTVAIENCIISNETYSLNTPGTSTELTFNIKATPISEGMPVGENIAFEPNSKVLTASGKDELSKLVKFANENIKIYFKVKISNKDSYFADKKEKKTVVDGKKKKTVTETIKADAQSRTFGEERVAVIQEYLLSLTPRKNFFIFESDPTFSKTKPKPAKPVKKGKTTTNTPTNYNLVITVDKVR